MEFEHYLTEIRELLPQQEWERLKELLVQMAVQDIAHVLMELDDEHFPVTFRLLPDDRRNPVFAYLDPPYQRGLITHLSELDARTVLQAQDPDDLTALLEYLPPDEARHLLRLLPFRAIRRALTLLGYPEDSVGRLMTPHFVSVRPVWTVGAALAYIRAQSEQGETVNTLFVTDSHGKLLGAIPLHEFVRARPFDKVERLIQPVHSVTATVDREHAAQQLQHYDLETLPVTDDEGGLLGIVTVDDVLDVLEKETTEDFHKMGSVGAVHLSLRDAPARLLFQKRIGWLLVLVFINLIGGWMISGYEEIIEAVVVLVFFLPLIIASGGNAGAQSSTLMVRALATGDVHSGDWLRLWGRELAVSAALGLTMALVISTIGLWRGGIEVALVVALAMVLIVMIGSLFGMLLPFLLNRFRYDPATASVPLVTSVADIAGILIYFSIAMAIVGLPDLA